MSASEGRGKEGASGSGAAELPHIDFATFILSLSHNGMMHLGDAPSPDGAAPPQDLELARQSIDLLALLEEKTRGNLTGEEEHILSMALTDLRQRFDEVSRGT